MITAAAWIVATALDDDDGFENGAVFVWLVILAGLMLFDLEMAQILAGGL